MGAFGDLYDEYYPRIFNYCLRRTANIAAAQDITSDVFMKALKGIRAYIDRGIPFSAWLYRIANRAVADHYRNSMHNGLDGEETERIIDRFGHGPEDDLEQAETELERNEEYLRLHRHISALDIKYQEVISLKYFEKKQIREIAEILGKREGTVKSLLSRGIDRLRRRMAKEGGTNDERE